MAANAKPDNSEIAGQIITLVQADLPGTMAMMAGILETMRKADDKLIGSARLGADALRLELNHWRIAPSKSPERAAIKKLMEEAAKAATQ